VSILTTFFDDLGSGDSVGGAALKVAGNVAGSAAGAVADSGLNAISGWVLNGTKSALEQVAHLIGATTAPNLTASWFSSTYLRVAGLAALLTVPFLFAAMLQAILRSDLALIGKVVFTYLPVSLLSVSLAAPVVMLLLSATDQMCKVVSSAAIEGGARFLDDAALAAGGRSALDGSPFFAVMVGLFAVAAALMLALELVIRESAVYVVVLMLPLAFAAFVWPARRIWAIRLVELLISLILSKFVIVAVLSLAGSALGSSDLGISQLLTATALLLLSTFAPWALLRILPFTELAAGAATALRHELTQVPNRAMSAAGPLGAGVETGAEMALALPTRLRHHADQAGQGNARTDHGPATVPVPHTPTGTPAQVPESQISTGLAAPVPDPQSPDYGPASVDAAVTARTEASEDQSMRASSEGPSEYKPVPLSHVKAGMRLDLSRGVWVEPDEDD
jgi:hypothetical protein